MVFWAHRVLVERRRWLTEQEFVDLLALGQLLPGPNVLNLTVMVGYRFAGWTGAPIGLPILHLPQLIGLGLGFNPDELQLKRHIVPTRTVAEKVQLLT